MYKKSNHKPFKDLEQEKISESNLHTFEKVAAIMQLFETQKTNPIALIEHEENQLNEKPLDEDFTFEWDSLAQSLNDARKALESEEINRIACAFYWLGIASSKLDAEKADNNYQISLLDSHIARAKSNMPLEKKRITAQLVREVAIGFAKIYWNEHEKKDEDERPRISEAAEFIHQTIKTTFSSEKYQKEIEGSGYEIPEDITIIKKWLRPTAPAWAKKGGRPPKKNNFAKE